MGYNWGQLRLKLISVNIPCFEGCETLSGPPPQTKTFMINVTSDWLDLHKDWDFIQTQQHSSTNILVLTSNHNNDSMGADVTEKTIWPKKKKSYFALLFFAFKINIKVSHLKTHRLNATTQLTSHHLLLLRKYLQQKPNLPT